METTADITAWMRASETPRVRESHGFTLRASAPSWHVEGSTLRYMVEKGS